MARPRRGTPSCWAARPSRRSCSTRNRDQYDSQAGEGQSSARTAVLAPLAIQMAELSSTRARPRRLGRHVIGRQESADVRARPAPRLRPRRRRCRGVPSPPRSAVRPATTSSLVLGAVTDLARGKAELVAEDALLRQPPIVPARSTKRPRRAPSDRALLVLPAGRVRTRRHALLIVQSATLLRWHRAGFRLLWRWRSTPRSRPPRGSPDVVALIGRMARENRLWGAERIPGELLKLGIPLGKRTVQRRMRGARPPRPGGQSWATFLRTHGREIRACDVLRPHQGIGQRPPPRAGTIAPPRRRRTTDGVISHPVLGGLHHEYRSAA